MPVFFLLPLTGVSATGDEGTTSDSVTLCPSVVSVSSPLFVFFFPFVIGPGVEVEGVGTVSDVTISVKGSLTFFLAFFADDSSVTSEDAAARFFRGGWRGVLPDVEEGIMTVDLTEFTSALDLLALVTGGVAGVCCGEGTVGSTSAGLERLLSDSPGASMGPEL